MARFWGGGGKWAPPGFYSTIITSTTLPHFNFALIHMLHHGLPSSRMINLDMDHSYMHLYSLTICMKGSNSCNHTEVNHAHRR